jgi:DNA polymerase III epsilon subunit family exonuclease
MISNFVAIDFEFLPSLGRIIQIGYVVVRNGVIVDTYEQLVNPCCSRQDFYLVPMVSNITGITYDMVQNAPTFEDVWPDLYKVINKQIIVAHNACSADLSVLSKELFRICERTDQYSDIAFDCYCTMNIAKSLSHSKCGLSILCQEYDIELSAHHNAFADAEATAKLFIEFVNRYNIRHYSPVRFDAQYIYDRGANCNQLREPFYVTRNKEERKKKHIDIAEIQEKLDTVITSPAFFCDEVIVITGLSCEDRESLISKLSDAGAIVKNNITKCTTLVIAGENAGWSKLEKAIEQNIPVINRGDIAF